MENLKKELSYFDVLGVDEDANLESIKLTYKKLVKQYHPDKYQDQTKKKEAEKQFKIIKKAYDALMEEFETKDCNESIDKVLANEDFISFFTNHNINKTKTWEKANKDEDAYEEAYKFIENQIKKFKIDWLYVFECIRKNKMFIHWEASDIQLKRILLKETMFRKKIINSPLYICFIENRKLFLNPNIKLNIFINPSFLGKKVEQKINYTCPKICKNCFGFGCTKCNNGIIFEQITKNLKFTNIENNDLFEIKNSGFQNKLCKGSLIIKFIFDSKQQEPLLVKQKNIGSDLKNNLLDEKFLELKILAMKQIQFFLNFIKQHKIHVIYSSIIILLIIIIILLACLL